MSEVQTHSQAEGIKLMFTFTGFHFSLTILGITLVWFLLTFLHFKQLQNKLDETKISKDPEVSWFLNVSAVLSLLFQVLVIACAFVGLMVFDPSQLPPN